MSDLSIEAKVMQAGFWGILFTADLTFKRPHILTVRARKGLDDLTEAGLLSVSTHSLNGSMTWKPTEAMRRAEKVDRSWANSNSFAVTRE